MATYTITGESGREKIKPVNPESSFNPSPGGGIKFKESSNDRNRGFALSYAKDFICAQINSGSKNLGPADVLLIAEDFNGWLNNEDKPEAVELEIDTRIHNEDVLPF